MTDPANDDLIDAPQAEHSQRRESGRHRAGATAFFRQVIEDLAQDADAQADAGAQAPSPPRRKPGRKARGEAGAASGPTVALGDILDRLDARAFGLLILLFALPCCLPFVYVLPQIVALPMLALAGQLAIGRRHPWLPAKMRMRRVSATGLSDVLRRSERYVGWFERLARPRLAFVTDGAGARVVGLLMLIPATSILLPIPTTNTIPGIGVAIASIGLIERDGVLVIAGLVIGFAWIALLLTLGSEAISILHAMVTGS